MGMLLDVAENRASFKALAVEDLLLETTETGHPAFQIKPSPLPKAFVQGPNWDSAEIKIFSQAEQYMGPPGVKGILHDDGDATGDASSSSGSERYMTSWMVSVHGDEVGGDGVLPHEVPPGCSQPFSYEPMFYPKKIGPATRNMLLDVNFNPVTFAAWWATTNISNDFWIENEECLVRVHVIPRRFVMSLRFRYFGSEGAFSVGRFRCLNPHTPRTTMAKRTDLYTSPVVTRAKTLSEFNKAELLEEAKARNLWVNDRWTTVELRSAIQEDRRNPSPNDPANATKGMGTMTIDQLKARAMELGYHIPPYATRGTIMRILRDQGGMNSQSVLGFGRFAGKAFEDTPVSYRTWALREVENNDNPSEDLVMFANWWQGQLHKWNNKVPEKTPVDRFDAETCATIPYVEDASSTASWDVLHRESLAAPMTPQPKEPAMPTATRMEQEIPPEVNEEVIENYGEDTGDGVPNHGVSYYIEDDYEETDTDDEGNYDDYLDHFGFDEAAVTYVTEGERNGADINPGGSGDEVQRETPRVRDRRGQVEVCEAKAKAKLEKKEYAFDDLLEIAKILPLRRLRKGKALCRSGGYSFEYFLGGMYTHGNMKGLSRQSGEMPWVVKYMNSFMKAQGYGQWSSFVLFKNAATNVHADSHNLAGTTIKTVSFGPFTGGELWMSDFDRDPDIPGTVWRKDAAGNEIPGYLVDTRHQVYTFDGKAKHATQPWIGERWVLSLYTTRGYQESTADLRDQLRELRFPLRGLPLLPEVHGQAQGKFVRPVKSMRKSLWKKASRLAALTTWCATAGLSCTAEAFPLTRGREAVALYEIGGVEKTLEVTGLDYLVAEPIDDLYNFTTTSVSETVQSTIRELTPAVVWVHGDKAMGYFDGIYDHLCEHVDKGRQLAVKAPPGDPCWESPGLNRILRRYEGAWRCREQEPDVIRVNDIFYYQDDAADAHAMSQFDTYVADHTADRGGEDSEGTTAKIGAEAISFEKGKNLAPEVKSSLRRLHQNLGHPSNTDLARHLRLAGADPVVIDACKRLRCQVCQRNKRGSTPKPASLPTLLEFNQVVAVDAFYVYDCEGTKVELMMAIDVGTGFALAGELQGHSTLTMEATFCLQAGLGRYSEWHGTFIRPIAGQAHWQNGTVERAIRTWKEVWVKLVDERSAYAEEANMVITAVNSAMNTLRRDSGFSPSQAVWGRDPKLPEDVHQSFQDDHVEHIISRDRQRAREHTLRIAAKECNYRCRNDAKLRKGLLQRSRVAGPDLQVGCHVFFYRKPKNNKNWVWHGPGIIIGQEGPNHWVSFSGRCHLVAPEHLRMASGEELGAAFALRATKEDLERLLDQDFGEEVLFEDDSNEMEVDPELPPGDDQDLPDGDGRTEASRRKPEATSSAPVPKRYRTKGPQELESHDPTYDAYMMKLAKTPRGREKALEKEIPWSMVPPEQQENFKQAELKQYSEHVEHNALEPLSVEVSRKVMKEQPDRVLNVLNSRFAYRDKHWSRRRQEPSLSWKAKARLVIAGHRDPDLLSGLPTHAPTISRQGIHLLLQVLASNLRRGWKGFAGDVTAAFLCGEDLQRELYLKQPKTGLGDLHPEQLLRIRKPIFGLVDSPAAWWTKLHKTLKKMRVKNDDGEWIVIQNTLDHCIFMVQKVLSYDEESQPRLGAPEAYLGVHVDDVLLVGDGALCDLLKCQLSSEFPIQEWEEGKFEYVGSYIEVMEDRVKVSQASYAATRLFQVETDKNNPDHFEASEVERHDNQSLIRALSWMASQTRPDLQVGVSMSQQCQKSPTVGDVRFTNQLARRAMEHKEEGLTFFPVDLDKAVLLCYHDAGWANVPQSDDDPYYRLTDGENLQGKIQDGPLARREAKMKKANSTIASQFGGLYILAEEDVIYGKESHGSILDWKSGACERVCRSTFAAETMACSTATETGEFIAKFLETVLTGKLARHATRFGLRFLSDCRSLYDHLTRDGVPRVPTCKRLSIDLAGIRQDLKSCGRIVWVPTGAQLADILTKPLRSDEWWATIKSPLFRSVPLAPQAQESMAREKGASSSAEEALRLEMQAAYGLTFLCGATVKLQRNYPMRTVIKGIRVDLPSLKAPITVTTHLKMS
ncbi:Copia protein [Symbiodinium microadriaticum]|uniref:Copia protein n=1 Tax=Symbiodinium microadriaticum TaxID=2951 RepID=A0A1Q9E8M0_SYMMI|nr:Copia protein [Symbiodinium microadriaticum]